MDSSTTRRGIARNRAGQLGGITLLAVFCGFGIALWAGPASANLIVNGSFESCVAGVVATPCTNGQVQYTGGPTLQGWTTTSTYSFLIPPSGFATTAGNTTVTTAGQSGTVSMYTFSSLSPDGGNFLLQDSAYGNGTLSQTLTGLIIGQSYQVNFSQAAAQQTSYNGATDDWWHVTFGTLSQDSTKMLDPDHGYINWMSQSMVFVANATSLVLGFLASSTSGGLPPFAALDGVSVVVAVPEPGTATLLAAGLAGIGLLRRRPARRG